MFSGLVLRAAGVFCHPLQSKWTSRPNKRPHFAFASLIRVHRYYTVVHVPRLHPDHQSMSRHRSLFLCPLLILIQLLSPWVHAHTGCDTGEPLHIPGLERLRGPEAISMPQTDLSAADTLVGIQAGIQQSGFRLGKLMDSYAEALLNWPLLAEPPPLVLRIRENTAGNALPRQNPHPGSPPRASPTDIHL